MEQMRERVKAAMVSYVFQECQPDKGDIFGWFDDRADEIADAALSLMQPEIDRRVAEEKAKLLERFDEDELEQIISNSLDMDWLPRDAARAIRQAMLAQFERENSDG